MPRESGVAFDFLDLRQSEAGLGVGVSVSVRVSVRDKVLVMLKGSGVRG